MMKPSAFFTVAGIALTSMGSYELSSDIHKPLSMRETSRLYNASNNLTENYSGDYLASLRYARTALTSVKDRNIPEVSKLIEKINAAQIVVERDKELRPFVEPICESIGKEVSNVAKYRGNKPSDFFANAIWLLSGVGLIYLGKKISRSHENSWAHIFE